MQESVSQDHIEGIESLKTIINQILNRSDSVKAKVQMFQIKELPSKLPRELGYNFDSLEAIYNTLLDYLHKVNTLKFSSIPITILSEFIRG